MMTSLPAPKPLANHAVECATSYGAECDCFTHVLWRDPEKEPPVEYQDIIALDRWGNCRITPWIPGWMEARNTIGWAPVPRADD